MEKTAGFEAVLKPSIASSIMHQERLVTMRRLLLWMLCAPAMACVFSASSWAADLTFFIGGVRPGSVSVENVKKSLDGSALFGLRVNTGWTPVLGLEHTLAFSHDYLFPSDAGDVRDARGFIYSSNLIVNLSLKKVVPYITAGAGLIHQYGDRNLPVGTEFAFNYGGGVKVPRLKGPLGLRFDVRGYSVGAFSNKLNLLEVSGGVLLSLGK